MGVRPPPSNDDRDSRSVEFGIAELTAHLDDADLSFPATDQEVVRALSDPDVAYDPRGRTVSLSAVVERVDRERFESEADLLNALHPEFERRRTASTGVLGWLRSFFATDR